MDLIEHLLSTKGTIHPHLSNPIYLNTPLPSLNIFKSIFVMQVTQNHICPDLSSPYFILNQVLAAEKKSRELEATHYPSFFQIAVLNCI